MIKDLCASLYYYQLICVLSITLSNGLKYSPMIMDLYVSTHYLVIFYFIYFETGLVGT
jgi:hypothetical protein